MALEELSSLLWQEHELLDLLLFKAEEKQYVIVSNKVRWLPRLAREIEVILSQLRDLEVQRAAATEMLCAERGLAGTASLRDLADAVGEPWQQILLQHHENLLQAVTQIRALSDVNRELVDEGLALINDQLATSGSSAGLYTAAGHTSTDVPAGGVTWDGRL